MALNRTWLAGFLLVAGVHAVWHSFHSVPPAWDMAHHQAMGWTLLEAAQSGRLLEALVDASDYYPPFVYLLEALVLALTGDHRWLPLLVNLPGLALLSWSTFRLAWLLTASRFAPAAGWMVLVAPLIAWTSRESLLDPWLSAWVAASLLILVRSRGLLERRWVWAMALSVAAGMLTKWSYILFVVPAGVWIVAAAPGRRQRFLNLLDTVLLSAPLFLWWYLPNARTLYQRLQHTAAGADWELDPQLDSLLGWIYYPRSLSSYYLFLPLTLVWVAGLVRAWRSRAVAPEPSGKAGAPGSAAGIRRLLAVSLLGGLVLLTVLKAKDPRYVMPLAAPLFVLLVDFWKDRPRLLTAVTAWAAAQFLLVSFHVPGIPERIGWFELPGDRAYRSMRQEWVWFETSYFGVTGPPRREDWKIRELLGELPEAARVAFVPDAASFHPGLLHLEALRQGRKLDIVRIGSDDDWPAQLGKVDWVIGKSGDQGISLITSFNDEVYAALETLKWPLVRTWELPDGSRALLWRSPSLSR